MSPTLINQLLWPFKSLPENYVVIDTETTGLFDAVGAPGIISLGVVQVDKGDTVDGKEFLFRPHRPITDEAYKIHGISQEQVQRYPTFDKQWPQISQYFSKRLVVIHNAAFDWPLIVDHIERYNTSPPLIEGVFCSQRAAQPWAQAAGIPCSERGPSLDTLSEYLGLDNLRHANNNQHGALIDARQTANVIAQLQRFCDQ